MSFTIFTLLTAAGGRADVAADVTAALGDSGGVATGVAGAGAAGTGVADVAVAVVLVDVVGDVGVGDISPSGPK